MKIFLPSNNMMGLTSIDMRDPKIGDLRDVPNLSFSSVIKKTQFVQKLTGDDVLKVTPQDRDYLFLIAVGAITLNRISLSTTCSCGQELYGEISISEVDPIRLPRSVPNTYEAMIYGQKVKFHKISVKDEMEIEERAVDLPDEDYDEEFQNGLVAKTLGYSLEAEDMQKVKNLDLSLYFAAILYQNCDRHGVTLIKDMVCPKCGKRFKTHLPITGDMLNVDVAQVMSRYVSIKEHLSMDSYFNLALPEYNTFIKSLNQRMKR